MRILVLLAGLIPFSQAFGAMGLTLKGDQKIHVSDCSRYKVMLTSEAGRVTAPADIIFRLDRVSDEMFYSDPLCQNPIEAVSISKRNASSTFYLKKLSHGFITINVKNPTYQLEASLGVAVNSYYTLQGIYLIGQDEEIADVEWESKLQTALIMVRRFYNKQLRSLYFTDVSLRLELNGKGLPDVVLVKGSKPISFYQDPANFYELRSEIKPFISGIDRKLITVVGTNLASFGGKGIIGGMGTTTTFFDLLGRNPSEQRTVFCDKTKAPPNEYDDPNEPGDPNQFNLTRGELASVRLGGLAHEIGHALFGDTHLPNPTDLMSAGFWGFSNTFVSGCNDSPNTTMDYSEARVFASRPYFRDTSLGDEGQIDVQALSPDPRFQLYVKPGQDIKFSFRVKGNGSQPVVFSMKDEALINYPNYYFESVDLSKMGDDFVFEYTLLAPPQGTPVGTYPVTFEFYNKTGQSKKIIRTIIVQP